MITTLEEIHKNMKQTIADKKSQYQYQRIYITGLYEWEKGYRSSETIEQFHTDIYDALKKNNFIIVPNYPADNISCDYLTRKDSKLYMYMHPMEFTGPATKEETTEIINILKTCNGITHVQSGTPIDLYDISENDYRNLLLDNAYKIAKNAINLPYPDETEITKRIRIHTVSQPALYGYSWLDTDCDVIRNILSEIHNANMTKKTHDEILQHIQQWADKTKHDIEIIKNAIDKITENMSLTQKTQFYGIPANNEEELLRKIQHNSKHTITKYYEIAEKHDIVY